MWGTAAAHDLGAGAGKLGHLPHGGIDIGGVRVGHGLYGDRRAAADGHAAYLDGNCHVPWLALVAHRLSPGIAGVTRFT